MVGHGAAWCERLLMSSSLSPQSLRACPHSILLGLLARAVGGLGIGLIQLKAALSSSTSATKQTHPDNDGPSKPCAADGSATLGSASRIAVWFEKSFTGRAEAPTEKCHVCVNDLAARQRHRTIRTNSFVYLHSLLLLLIPILPRCHFERLKVLALQGCIQWWNLRCSDRLKLRSSLVQFLLEHGRVLDLRLRRPPGVSIHRTI